jgi:hypothetical protein
MRQRAKSAEHDCEPSRGATVLLWLAVCCVALMPSIYRGGAEVPHAHSFFQFWRSPAEAFDHHDEAGASASSIHEHLRQTGVIVTSRCDALVDEVAFICTSASSALGPVRALARLSPMTDPGGTVELIVVTVLVAALALAISGRRLRVPVGVERWLDLRSSPESPPPRRSLAVAPFGW